MPDAPQEMNGGGVPGRLDRRDRPITSSPIPPIAPARFDYVAFLRHVFSRSHKRFRVGASGLIDGLPVADSSRRCVARGYVKTAQTRVIA
jgi:hypothetical protein